MVQRPEPTVTKAVMKHGYLPEIAIAPAVKIRTRSAKAILAQPITLTQPGTGTKRMLSSIVGSLVSERESENRESEWAGRSA